MPQKHESDASLNCDRRAPEAERIIAARPEVTPLDSARSKSEFHELLDRWSFLERLYALPF